MFCHSNKRNTRNRHAIPQSLKKKKEKEILIPWDQHAGEATCQCRVWWTVLTGSYLPSLPDTIQTWETCIRSSRAARTLSEGSKKSHMMSLKLRIHQTKLQIIRCRKVRFFNTATLYFVNRQIWSRELPKLWDQNGTWSHRSGIQLTQGS